MIRLTHGPMRAALVDRGATLAGLWHKAYPANLVLGYRTASDYLDDPFYLGAIVGPLANRISGARVVLDGQPWQLQANEGTTCLHGGSEGLARQNWQVAEQTTTSVTFSLALLHGAGGLPGARQISVCYQLDIAALQLDIRATSDCDTYFNAAHHPYWRLDARSFPPRHNMTVAAQSYLPADRENLPTGDVASVEETAYDFRASQCVSTDQKLDANLCLSDHRRNEPHFAAKLTCPDGPQLTIETTEPGLQIYNGSGLHDAGTLLDDGKSLYPFAGLALEPQGWPDAPNQAGFPSVLLRAGEPYHQRTVYRLSV